MIPLRNQSGAMYQTSYFAICSLHLSVGLSIDALALRGTFFHEVGECVNCASSVVSFVSRKFVAANKCCRVTNVCWTGVCHRCHCSRKLVSNSFGVSCHFASVSSNRTKTKQSSRLSQTP